jgi:hypothetical protein
MEETVLLEDLLTWLPEAVLQSFLYVYQFMLIGLANFINFIPLPNIPLGDGVINVGGTLSSILAMFNFDLGVVLIMNAYFARFLIRRIPFIGG